MPLNSVTGLKTVRSNVKSIVEGALGDTGELLRLSPTWVPRSFLQPGLRIKLHPDATYAYGLNGGGIDERWFASTTETANEGRGGNDINNSGGLHGLKYDVTRDYVMGLEAVLPNSEIIWLGNKCVKDVAGYSLKDLFIGSEGTLGIITRLILKVLPKPKLKRTFLAIYASMKRIVSQ